MVLQNLFGPRLVQAGREAKRIASCVRDAPVLAERRYVGFPRHATSSFGDVEYDVGVSGPQGVREVVVSFEPDNITELATHFFDGVNGRGVIPLGILVRVARSAVRRRSFV